MNRMLLSTYFSFLLILNLTNLSTCLELIADPDHIQAYKTKETVTLCKTENQEPIDECQFRIWYDGKKQDGWLMNVTESNKGVTQNISNDPADKNTNYTADYSGSDFNAGLCRVKLNGVVGGNLLAGCKLTTKSNITAIKTVPLFYKDSLKLGLKKNSLQIIRKLGGNATFSLETKNNVSLSKCNCKVKKDPKLELEITDAGFTVKLNDKAQPASPGYDGSGMLKNGVCSFTFTTVNEDSNGVVYCTAESKDGKQIGAMVVTIIVPRKPDGPPELTLDKGLDEYSVGDSLTATCTVRGVRQPTIIWTWTLGATSIGYSSAGWSWPWEAANISQSVTIRLANSHLGKSIECNVGDKMNMFVLQTSLPLQIKTTTTMAPTSVTRNSSGDSPTEEKVDDKQTGSQPPHAPEDDDGSPRTMPSTSPNDALMWEFSMTSTASTLTPAASVTISCKAEAGIVLSECGFQIGQAGAYSDAILGPESAGTAQIGDFTVKYLVSGSGLENGECGILLTADNYMEEVLQVGCRGRTEKSGWKYNYTSLVDPSWSPEQLRMATVPNTPFLSPGSSLTVRCDSLKETIKLQGCRFTLPGKPAFELTQNDTAVRQNGYRYNGTGLDKGQCGIFIANVSALNTSKSNLLSCEAKIRANIKPSGAVRIVIAEPPVGNPVLKFNPPNPEPGKTLEATCTASESRPPASISWYFDGQLLTSANTTEVPVGKWRWRKDLETTTQILKMQLTADDEGKKVQCVIKHMALAEERKVALLIAFVQTSTPISPTTPTSKLPKEPPDVTAGGSTSHQPGGDHISEGKPVDPSGDDPTGVIIGVLAGVLVVAAAAFLVAFAVLKKKACFKERESEEKALALSRLEDSRTPPQNGQPTSAAQRKPQPQTQLVQPLRNRKKTPPPEEQQLQPVIRPSTPEDEKVEYAEIQKPKDAPPPRPVSTPVVPAEEEVEYAELSWNHL